MVMRTYFKTVFRTVKNNMGRFVAITLIIALGITFITGLGTLSHKFEESLGSIYKRTDVADIIVKTESATGFSEDTKKAITENENISKSVFLTMMDGMEINEKNARIYIAPLSEMEISKIELSDGRMPENGDEILVERASEFVDEVAIGETMEIMGGEKTVVGIAGNPLILYNGGEPDQVNEENLELIVYFDSQYINLPLPTTDIYLTIDKSDKLSYFSDEYIDEVDKTVSILEENAEEDLHFLTLEENKSYALAKSYAEKIDVITLIFPIFFVAVAALVVLTTMTRLIEEERSAIGCYQTLGYGDARIAFKYIGFSLFCSILGSAIGFAIGVVYLPYSIYPAFRIMFFMSEMVSSINPVMGIIAIISMIAVVNIVTAVLIKKEMEGQPANLLRPKSPKAGRVIFLEKIPFIWKHLSFRYKSTFRNIFRYVKHLLMTIVSVAGSTAIIVAGLGLYDISNSDTLETDMSYIGNSLSLISFVVIIFAIVLCLLVIFNLTNMNIGERKRELATLKVLGYYDWEVSGYIFREIFISSFFGIIFGIPAGYGITAFIFGYMDFGSVKDVNWYSYLAAALIVIALILIVDIIMHFKIKKIDMTSSLKTVE